MDLLSLWDRDYVIWSHSQKQQLSQDSLISLFDITSEYIKKVCPKSLITFCAIPQTVTLNYLFNQIKHVYAILCDVLLINNIITNVIFYPPPKEAHLPQNLCVASIPRQQPLLVLILFELSGGLASHFLLYIVIV